MDTRDESDIPELIAALMLLCESVIPPEDPTEIRIITIYAGACKLVLEFGQVYQIKHTEH